MKKIVLIFLFLFLSLNAREYTYLVPHDNQKAQKHMVNLFKHANRSIKIAIYSFTNREFLKALKYAARKGIKITIVADKESNSYKNRYSIIPQLAKLKNVEVKLLSGKRMKNRNGLMHIKLAIIDDRIVSFGSANYSYSAFNKNYELVYINDNLTFTKQFIPIFNKLNKEAEEY
jgi:phosphatidylserine/phosphatidylglycerophosphate/cardiolipin synthase-like enzyme